MSASQNPPAPSRRSKHTLQPSVCTADSREVKDTQQKGSKRANNR